MTNKDVFESIMLKIYEAIDTEVGEKREYKDTTELDIVLIQEELKNALGLPIDHYL
jgi:hypothetical protein